MKLRQPPVTEKDKSSQTWSDWFLDLWKHSPFDESGNVNLPSKGAFYLGEEGAEGSWRIVRSGEKLIFQRKESGEWVTQSSLP
jgi:hypothetical protein